MTESKPQLVAYVPSEPFYPLGPDDLIVCDPSDRAFQQSQRILVEFPQVAGNVFIQSPDHPATRQTQAQVVLIQHSDYGKPGKQSHLIPGYKLAAQEAVKQAEKMSRKLRPVRGLLFVEEPGKKATIELECPECNTRKQRQNFDALYDLKHSE